MEKPSFKQVIVINGFSLHQNSTYVNIIFVYGTPETNSDDVKEIFKLLNIYYKYILLIYIINTQNAYK